MDSTNVITPLVSVITNIDLEHMEYLGDTLRLIAEEKAGIIKKIFRSFTGATQRRFSRFRKCSTYESFPAVHAGKGFCRRASRQAAGRYSIIMVSEASSRVCRIRMLGRYQCR